MQCLLPILLVLLFLHAAEAQDVKPTIVGQKDLSTQQGKPITIQMTDLHVEETSNEDHNGQDNDNDNDGNSNEDQDDDEDEGDDDNTLDGDSGSNNGNDHDEEGGDDDDEEDENDNNNSDDRDDSDNKGDKHDNGNKDDKDDRNDKDGKGDKKNKDDKGKGNGGNSRAAYPEGYVLEIFSGENYTYAGSTVTPDEPFTGTLIVEVRVKNEKHASPTFDLEISVFPQSENQAPVITGQIPLNTPMDTPVEIKLSHIQVEDTDDKYPEGFTLSLTAGANFTLNGTTVTPHAGFTGELSVQVIVSDGTAESEPFMVKITVTAEPENIPPEIAGQVPLSISANQSVEIVLSHLLITDPDNQFPQDFELHVHQGQLYSLQGATVTPAADYTGDLIVKVSVNDGKAESNVFNFHITVTPNANHRPVITGQTGIKITQEQRFEVGFDHLVVEDPDNVYPEGFSMSLSAGENYTFENRTITPVRGFRGTLTVMIIVHDGKDPSEPYALQVEVIEAERLEIIGQQTLEMREDSTFYLQLSHLSVNDPSGTYPEGFSIQVLNGSNYDVENGSIRPHPDFSGNITVPVAVSKNGNSSGPFDMLIVVMPVNDPPELLNLEDTPLVIAGSGPFSITERTEVADVDDDFMLLAEIAFDTEGYQPGIDHLEFEKPANIHGVFDAATGVLFLVGRGTIEEYGSLLRSIRYTRMTGADSLRLFGSKNIYLKLNDGKNWSSVYSRALLIETNATLDIPSAFTPNNDQANDTWKIISETNEEGIDAFVRVYDKKGVLVFEAANLQIEWDGYFDGSPLPSDVYFYTIEMDVSHKKVNYKGIVSILR